MQVNKESKISKLVAQNLNIFEECMELRDQNKIPVRYVQTSIDCLDRHGKTSLFHAISNKQIDKVNGLIQCGANLEKPSFVSFRKERLISCSETPLLTAARLGCVDIMEVLLSAGCDVNSQSHFHAQLGSKQAADRTALHVACEDSNLAMLKLLLQFGARVDMVDRKQELPIHLASRCQPKIHAHTQSDMMKLLCQHGSSVNAKTKIDCTPLYLAVFYKCIDTFKVLLDYGADVNCVVSSLHNHLSTALHVAAFNDCLTTSELLITHNAQISFKTCEEGYSPIQLNLKSHSQSRVVWLLLYHGADLAVKDKFSFTLMTYCVKDMRLDCEALSRMLVYAGYQLNQDHWLMPEFGWATDVEEGCRNPTFSTAANPESRMYKLVVWLRKRLTSASGLQEMCRVKVRSQIQRVADGCSIVGAISSLPVPAAVKHYLLLHDVIYMLENLYDWLNLNWLPVCNGD